MVQTRAQERGAPLKKPGAYNTDAYYDEVDQGFGDVGVDQVRAAAGSLRASKRPKPSSATQLVQARQHRHVPQERQCNLQCT